MQQIFSETSRPKCLRIVAIQVDVHVLPQSNQKGLVEVDAYIEFAKGDTEFQISRRFSSKIIFNIYHEPPETMKNTGFCHLNQVIYHKHL